MKTRHFATEPPSLAKREALSCGFDEAILLNINGTIAERPGENIFMVKDNIIYTPYVASSALPEITAQSTKEIAKNLNIEVIQKTIICDKLFLADELFFTETAAQVTLIREIHGRIIGSEKRGPITEQIQRIFFDASSCKKDTYREWLTVI